MTTVVESRAGAPFLLALCALIALAATAGLMLPWPPDPSALAMEAVVVALCGTAAWQVGGGRELRIDRAAGLVVETVTRFGLKRERRRPLADYDAIEVTSRRVRVARAMSGHDGRPRRSDDHEQHLRFVLMLRGRAPELRVETFADAVAAEQRALELAAVGGWTARRRGYTLAAGRGEAGGAVVRVRVVDGAGSDIGSRCRPAP